MKKTVCLLFIILSLLFVGAASFTGCHNHRYFDKVVAPSCTKDGYTRHQCACGDIYYDNYVDAFGHTEGKTENIKINATYNTYGLNIEETFCSVCGKICSVNVTTIPKLEHRSVRPD